MISIAATGVPFATFNQITTNRNMNLTLLRNATCIIDTGDYHILIDPMLADKDTYDPVRWTSNGIRNPIVNLPVSARELNQLITDVDAVLITHTHNDHWDKKAQELIPKNKLIYSQPEDVQKIRSQGFIKVTGISDELHLRELSIIRTAAQHGTGEIAELMSPVSGFVLDNGKCKIYIAGDTIWYSGVKKTIEQYQPDYIVLNTGGARFDKGDPIIMTAEDVMEVCKYSDAKKIICVHMEAINHCYLKRAELRKTLAAASFNNRCIVPEDGEKINL